MITSWTYESVCMIKLEIDRLPRRCSAVGGRRLRAKYRRSKAFLNVFQGAYYRLKHSPNLLSSINFLYFPFVFRLCVISFSSARRFPISVMNLSFLKFWLYFLCKCSFKILAEIHSQKVQ